MNKSKQTNDNWNNPSVASIITFIIMLLLAFGSFQFGTYIYDSGADTTNFCKQHYRNETFLSTMVGDEPAEPKVCDSSQWRTKDFWNYCDKQCSDNIDECLETKATDEQIRFMQECCWLCKDWRILAFGLFFGFAVPAMLFMIATSIIIGSYNDIPKNITTKNKDNHSRKAKKEARTLSFPSSGTTRKAR